MLVGVPETCSSTVGTSLRVCHLRKRNKCKIANHRHQRGDMLPTVPHGLGCDGDREGDIKISFTE